ncbi:hypothetical protein [Leptospira sp. GIMC2001]|uniref:hypothetical protein n=1 Tax=Leptospira sp. GIMC2001 TaxID=1513297 RepID=UPI0023495EBA|nr:hypothetical protein [Leptospira sp. GIMC2001]WCL49281.1 hypothetical protein O4O04_18615 [Leptospira sp. GIMC2001]
MKYLALSFIILLSSVACTSKQPTNKPSLIPNKSQQGEEAMSFPKNVEEYIGKETMAALKKAKTGESYKVGSKKSDSGKLLAGYPILEKGKDLTSGQIKTLTTILLDSKSFVFPTAKKVMFLPKYGFKLDEVIVLIDSTHQMVSIPVGDKSNVEDYDPIQKKIDTLISDLF